jgi:hypothetical protein
MHSRRANDDVPCNQSMAFAVTDKRVQTNTGICVPLYVILSQQKWQDDACVLRDTRRTLSEPRRGRHSSSCWRRMRAEAFTPHDTHALCHITPQFRHLKCKCTSRHQDQKGQHSQRYEIRWPAFEDCNAKNMPCLIITRKKVTRTGILSCYKDLSLCSLFWRCMEHWTKAFYV